MPLSEVGVGVRNIWRQRGPRNPNRQDSLHPWLGRIALPKRIAGDPLDRPLSTKQSWQQISGRQVFDFAVAAGGLNSCAPQQALAAVLPRAAVLPWAALPGGAVLPGH